MKKLRGIEWLQEENGATSCQQGCRSEYFLFFFFLPQRRYLKGNKWNLKHGDKSVHLYLVSHRQNHEKKKKNIWLTLHNAVQHLLHCSNILEVGFFLDMTFGSGLYLLKPKLHNLQPKCVVFTRRDLSSIISNMCDTDRLSHGWSV